MVARGATVQYLIMEAYNLDEREVVRGPSWIAAENGDMRFDIEAKPPADVAARYAAPRDPKVSTPDEIRQMLQNLLADRFQLKVHLQQGQGQIYELVRSNRPLRLSPPKDENAYPWAGGVDGEASAEPTGIRGINVSMPELARRLTEWLRTPVVDHTGITGSYDFFVEVDPRDAVGVEDSIPVALRQLGFALKKTTGTVYKLVVDRVSLPSPN